MQFSEIQAFVIFMAMFAIGDLVSTATEAKLPSLFTISVLSIAGYWSGLLPLDFFALTGISVPLVYVVYYLQLPNMGALISMDEMKKQWRTILVATFGLVGIALGAVLIGGLLFGREAAIVGAPPLAGGIVAYQIMADGANELGRPELAVMALAVFVLQSIIGLPMASYFLKKEARSILEKYRAGGSVGVKTDENAAVAKQKLIPPIPAKYNGGNMILFKLAIAGLIGVSIAMFLNRFKAEGAMGDLVSRYVVLLIVGFILHEIGFLDTSPIYKSQVGGFTALVIIGFAVVGALAQATPEIVFSMIGPTVGIMATGVIGLVIVASVGGKFLGYSPAMSIACGLTALFGYPGTEILTKEVAAVIAANEDEKTFLVDSLLPKMLISGFTTVTFGSVFMAGLFINML